MSTMRRTIILLVLLIGFVQISIGQSNWMIAEKLSKDNRWNKPFYTPFNSVAKLEPNRLDSAVYCTDCSMGTILFQAITKTELASYQLTKSHTLAIVKISELNKKYTEYLKAIKKSNVIPLAQSIHLAEIVIYRRPVTIMPYNLKELSVEWLALEIKDTSAAAKKITPFRIYMRANECFTVLNASSCQWTHSINQEYISSYSSAITNRNYLVQEYSIVSVNTLQIIPEYGKKEKMPTLAYNLLVNDPNKSHGIIPNEHEPSAIHLFAVCSADIRDQKNLGYHKAQLPTLLIELFQKGALNAYRYHEGGYFTPLLKENLLAQLVITGDAESEQDLRITSTADLYTLHVLKKFVKINASLTITNEWLVLGLGSDQASTFNNTYAIAFQFQEVLKVLAQKPMMWFNGTNQQDSVRLDEAIRTQRIAYKEMSVYTIYSDTILQIQSTPFYKEIKYADRLSATLYPYTQALVSDYDASNRRINRIPKIKTTTYQLTYYFTKASNTVLTRSNPCTDLLLKAIADKKMHAYEDATLHKKISEKDVRYKLDKARFYITGNPKKDSAYISTLPDADRYIPTDKLTEFFLHCNYLIQDGKEENHPISLGIVIPADQNPQYDTEMLCYVSFPALLQYLSHKKETKKYVSQLSSLPNEKGIIRVTDFYEVLLYEDLGEDAYIKDGLVIPAFILQHISKN